MEERKSFFIVSLIGWIAVAALAAGLAYVLGGGKFATIVNESTTSTNTPTVSAVSSTKVLLGVPVPSAASDRLFALTVPENVVKEEHVAKGWRMTRLGTDADGPVVQAKVDGSFVVTGPDGWSVPLRTRGGATYKDASLMGRFDTVHAALTGRRDDQVYLLSASRQGEVRELYALPDNAQLVHFDQAAWFVTATPGEGIESAPSGPSSLIRVTADGLASVMATNTQLIVSAIGHAIVLPAPALAQAGPFAFSTEGGDLFILSASTTEIVHGRPLLWLDGERLLFARGPSVFLFDATVASSTLVTDLPAAPSLAAMAHP